MITLFAITISACVYFLIRNHWVFQFRREWIWKSDFIDGKLYPYHTLPSYERMLYSFWVLDFNKFFPPEVREAKP